MNLYDLYNEAKAKVGKAALVKELNIVNGTASRWESLQSVPEQYYFDLMRICGKDIDYSQFEPRQKDQFFTDSETANFCVQKFYETMEQNNIDLADYTFVEPSAGSGAFLTYLPDDTLAFDIEQLGPNITIQDFLTWTPENKKYIVIGNPPFGLRGQQALRFINKSLEFADFVAFILPPLFNSDGRGSPKKRIAGNLIYTEPISDKYYYPDGTAVSVQTIFQIWTRLDIKSLVENEEPPKGFKVFSISDGGTPGSTRNKKMIGACDFYLPSTVFGDNNMIMYDDFEQLPQRRGYGIKLEDINIDNIKDIDWTSVAFKSTNGATNLRMSLIIKAINDCV